MSGRDHAAIAGEAIALLDSASRRGVGAGEHGYDRAVSIDEIEKMVGLLNEMFRLGMDV